MKTSESQSWFWKNSDFCIFIDFCQINTRKALNKRQDFRCKDRKCKSNIVTTCISNEASSVVIIISGSEHERRCVHVAGRFLHEH